jgi:hypothetical protein
VAVYDVGESQALVPQRVEPGRRMRELSDAQVTGPPGQRISCIEASVASHKLY